MADSVIGALRVLLGIDTAAFSSGLKDAEKNLSGFASAMKSIDKSVAGFATRTQSMVSSIFSLKTALLGLATGAVAKFVESNIRSVAAMADTADRLGLTTDELQQFQYAAKIAGVENEELTKAFEQFNKRLGESKSGITGSESALYRLGITLDQVKKLSPADAFKLVAEKLADVQNVTQRANIEAELFGKTGLKLDNIFRLGADGLAKLANEAQRLGLVLDKETIGKAREADDELDRMGTALKVAAAKMAAEFLPVIKDLRAVFTSHEFQQGVKDLAANLASLFKTMRENQALIAGVAAAFAGWRLGSIAGPLGGLVGALAGFTIGMKAAKPELQALQEEYDKTAQRVEELKTEQQAGISTTQDATSTAAGLGVMIGSVNAQLAAEQGKLGDLEKQIYEILTRQAASAVTLGADIRTGTKTAGDSLAKIKGDAEAFTKGMNDLRAKALELTIGFEAGLAPGFYKAAVQMKILDENTKAWTLTVDTLNPKQKELNDQLLKIQALQFMKLNLSPWQEYNLELDKINLAFAKMPDSAEQAAQSSMKAAAKMVTVYGDAAANMMGSFADLATALGKGNKDMFAVAKAFSISQAIINVLVGVTKAIAQGGVLGVLMGASVLAAGMATVAKIIAEKPPTGMALGGSFTVKGAGGVDSQMVPIMATPGERVSVDQNKYGDTSASGRTITVQGIKPKDYYTGDVLRDIIDNINMAIGDGYKLKVA